MIDRMKEDPKMKTFLEQENLLVLSDRAKVCNIFMFKNMNLE